MQVLNTPLSDVKLIQPQRFGDSRGWFAEVFNQSTFSSAGLPTQFVQDNQSFSVKGVLRGCITNWAGRRTLVRVLSVIFGRCRRSPLQPRRTSASGPASTSKSICGRRPSALWIPEGARPRFPRSLRHRRSPLQDYQSLLPCWRTLHPLE